MPSSSPDPAPMSVPMPPITSPGMDFTGLDALFQEVQGSSSHGEFSVPGPEIHPTSFPATSSESWGEFVDIDSLFAPRVTQGDAGMVSHDLNFDAPSFVQPQPPFDVHPVLANVDKHHSAGDEVIADVEGIAAALSRNQPTLLLSADLVRQLVNMAVQGAMLYVRAILCCFGNLANH